MKGSILPLLIILFIIVLAVWVITRKKSSRSYFDPEGNYIGSSSSESPGTGGVIAEDYVPLPVPSDIEAMVDEELWYDDRPWYGGRWNPGNWHYGDPDDDYIGGDWNPANWF